ncbi:MAG: protein translocase subunit SecF [Actinomycetota bacterium]|nr:protein translocase subunit SecF [Actinomycetota bacterium]
MKTLKSLYLGENPVNFPKLWKKAFIASTLVLILGIGSFVFRGLNLGLDFEGGTSYEVRTSETTVSETREILSSVAASDSRVQKVDTDIIRIRSDIANPQKATELKELLENRIGEVENFEQVGPTWGSDVTNKATKALLVFFVVVAVYLTVRLEWKMALGALVAVIHDIIISVGVYSIFQFEITPATVVAFLTIMGYSLYDTIVVYDKVREITGRLGATEKYSYTELMNLALNRVAMRSINTSISSALPILSLLVIGSIIMGATTLQEFSVALLVGILVGSYSSIFLAASLVSILKEKEARWQQVKNRLEQKGVKHTSIRRIDREEASKPLETKKSERIEGVRGPARGRPSPVQRSGSIAPRPRKKRR